MPGPYAPLQHAEAIARRGLLDVISYDITLDLASEIETFRSVATIQFRSQSGRTFLDVKPVELHQLRLDGRRLDADLLEGGRYPLDLTEGEHELIVEATMPFRNDGEGLHRAVDPADGLHYVYAMSFMDAAPSIFACFDQPDLKAPYRFHVRAPHEWVVIANAPGRQVESGMWEFDETAPLSTYFVTLVAGPYHVIHDEHDGIPLGLSARASIASELERDADELLMITRQSFDELHRLFGIRYPFGQYHQAFVPEFNAGAMENPGCVTFRDPMIFTSRVTRSARAMRASTVAHEMAHQWFGNMVTPVWWDDLWLNESFAEYLGNRVTAEATEFSDARVIDVYARRQWGLVADQRPSTHPVAGNGAEDASVALQNFDGISYVKGCAILRQLNAALGDDLFFRGTVDLIERHRFGNATMHDLFASFERAGADDLTLFVTEWLRTAGPDRLEFERTRQLIRRTPPEDDPANRRHRIRVATATPEGSWVEHDLVIEADQTPVDIGDRPALLDPYLDTWALVIPDSRTIAALPEVLPEVADPMMRAGAWNAVRNALHNATISPAQVLAIAERALPIEDPEDSARRVMGWLREWVVPLHTDPADAMRRLHIAAEAKLAAAGPGSEEQLAAFRAVIAFGSDATVLGRWLGGDGVPDGIDLDVDLRWRILSRLAALGATDLPELQRHFDADPSAAAKIALAGARASLPDAGAKAWAWDCFTGATSASNYELEAIGLGFWREGQQALIDDYLRRYFEDLPATVSARSGWVLAGAAEHFFPRTALDPDTLAKTESLAADTTVDAGIRRRLADEADSLKRKLTILERFPGSKARP